VPKLHLSAVHHCFDCFNFGIFFKISALEIWDIPILEREFHAKNVLAFLVAVRVEVGLAWALAERSVGFAKRVKTLRITIKYT
jgi:hypothetical protein